MHQVDANLHEHEHNVIEQEDTLSGRHLHPQPPPHLLLLPSSSSALMFPPPASIIGLQNSPLILLVELCEVSVDEMQFKGVVLGAGDGTPHRQDLLFTGR